MRWKPTLAWIILFLSGLLFLILSQPPIASAVQTAVQIGNGGTGTTTTPSYGNVLVGGKNGEYEFVASSTFGTDSSAFSTTSAAYWLTQQTTSNLPEGSNLYFTNARAIAALTGQSNSIFTNGAGYLTSLAGAASSTLLSDNNTLSGNNIFTNALNITKGILYASSTNYATVFGINADMEATTSATQLGNTAFGFQALEDNTSDWNTAFGQGALASTTSGHFDTGVGDAPLELNTTGISDTAVGEAPLRNNISGSWDTAIGNDTMLGNTTGSFNTAYGAYTLGLNTTGASSTAVGYLAAYNNTTGNNNTSYGFESLFSNQTGSGNVALGYGAGAWETGSNAFYVNNVVEANTAGDKADSLLYGTFSGSAGSTAGQGLTINGTATTTGNSWLNTKGYVSSGFGPYDASPASNIEVNCQSEGNYCGLALKNNNGGGTYDGYLVLDLADEPSGIAQPLILDNATGYANCLQIEGGSYGCLDDYNTLASLWTVISPAYNAAGTESGMTTTMLGANGNDNTDYGIQNYPGTYPTGIDAYQNYYSTKYAQPLPEPDFSYFEQADGNNTESQFSWHWLVASTTPYGALGTTTSVCIGDVGSSTPQAFSNCGVAGSATIQLFSQVARTTALDVSTVSTGNVFTHNFDVLNNGTVGVASSTPSGILGVGGSLDVGGQIRGWGGPLDVYPVSSGGSYFFASDGGSGAIYTGAYSDAANSFEQLDLDGEPLLLNSRAANKVGVGTSTPGSLFSIGGIVNLNTATSTFYSSGGINLEAGCFAVNGTCVSGGSSGVTSVSGTTNQITSSGGTTPTLSLPNPVIFPGSFEAFASSTIGAGGANGLTVQGNATTTANTYLEANLTVGTTTQDNSATITVGPDSLNHALAEFGGFNDTNFVGFGGDRAMYGFYSTNGWALLDAGSGKSLVLDSDGTSGTFPSGTTFLMGPETLAGTAEVGTTSQSNDPDVALFVTSSTTQSGAIPLLTIASSTGASLFSVNGLGNVTESGPSANSSTAGTCLEMHEMGANATAYITVDSSGNLHVSQTTCAGNSTTSIQFQ